MKEFSIDPSNSWAGTYIQKNPEIAAAPIICRQHEPFTANLQPPSSGVNTNVIYFNLLNSHHMA